MNLNLLQTAVIEDMTNHKRKGKAKLPKLRVWKYEEYKLFYPNGMIHLEDVLCAEFVSDYYV